MEPCGRPPLDWTCLACAPVAARMSSSMLPWPSVPQTDVEVGARRVHVRVRAELHTAFLQIAHIDTVPVEASAFADVQFGIRQGSGD